MEILSKPGTQRLHKTSTGSMIEDWHDDELRDLPEYFPLLPLNNMDAVFANHYNSCILKYHAEDGTGMFTFTYYHN